MKIKLTKEQTKMLVWEDFEDYELVEEGDWEVGYKWQHCTSIVKQESTGKFFSYDISRSGSPYSDYYYSYEDDGTELVEVEKVTKTIVVESWEAVA